MMVAGYCGDEADVKIPRKSLKLITSIVWDLDGNHDSLDRQVAFRGIKDASGANVSEVVISTVSMDGRQVDSELRIVYRNGSFRGASAVADGSSMVFARLSDALKFIDSPGD